MPSNWREPQLIMIRMTAEFGVQTLYLAESMTHRIPRATDEKRLIITKAQAQEVAADIQGFLGEETPK